MISLEHSAQLVDRYDAEAGSQRAQITDDELARVYDTGEQLGIVVRPADIISPFGLQREITVSNDMTLGALGLNASMHVRKGGRAEITIDTVPPVSVEGQLVRLGNMNMPPHQELAEEQLTFIPDKNMTYRDLDFRDAHVDIR